jgi:hypothetical protein
LDKTNPFKRELVLSAVWINFFEETFPLPEERTQQKNLKKKYFSILYRERVQNFLFYKRSENAKGDFAVGLRIFV